MIREILLLGNEELYKPSGPVTAEDLSSLAEWTRDLRRPSSILRKSI